MDSELHIDKRGTKRWRLPNGLFHREDGPAIIDIFGYKAWYINNIRHREGGPAIEYVSGNKEWWLNGIKYTEQEYKKQLRLIKIDKIL